MKILKAFFAVIMILLQSLSCTPQSTKEFNDFTAIFKPLSLPINSIINLTSTDTLNGRSINDIIIRNQSGKPQYVDKNGNTTNIKQYYGLYPEEPFVYTTDEKINGKWIEVKHSFYNKIIPIGSIYLNPKFESAIIKVVASETTFYDLWNFTKDGKVLSVICLFWGIRDGGPKDHKVTFTIVNSQISKEGKIEWHENADGLETFRTYILNDDGLFQVIKEDQKGKAEF